MACKKMLAKYSETTDPLTAEFVAWTCALQPQSDVDWARLIAVASLPLAEGSEGSSVCTTHIQISFSVDTPDVCPSAVRGEERCADRLIQSNRRINTTWQDLHSKFVLFFKTPSKLHHIVILLVSIVLNCPFHLPVVFDVVQRPKRMIDSRVRQFFVMW